MNWHDNATDAQTDLFNSVLTGGQLTGEGDTLFIEKQHAAVSFDMLRPCVETPLIKVEYGELARIILHRFGSVEYGYPETVFRQVNHALHVHVFLRTLDPLVGFPFLALMTAYRALSVACKINRHRDVEPEDRINKLGTMFVTGACVRVKGSHAEVMKRVSQQKPLKDLRAADMEPMRRGDFEFYENRMKNSAAGDYKIDFAPSVVH